MKPQPGRLSSSSPSFGPQSVEVCSLEDESICGSQEAVEHPQAADRPAGPAALPAAALHSTGKGERLNEMIAFNEGIKLFNQEETGRIISATPVCAFACVAACLRHFLSTC